jgi:hypothetical protein
MNKEKIIFGENPDTAIMVMKKLLLGGLGINEETLCRLNPYTWADHDKRYRLWVIRGYIELVEPKDLKKRFDLLMGKSDNNFSKKASVIFKLLDKDNDEKSFKKSMQDLGFKINQMPSKKGPWTP